MCDITLCSRCGMYTAFANKYVSEFLCICICFECFCEDLCDSIQPLRDTLVLEVKQRKLAISKFTRDFRRPPSAEVSSEFVCPQLDLRLPHHHARFVPSLL